MVFGAGGDRDNGKRPQMGGVAAKLADVAYVTDDNPAQRRPGAHPGRDPRRLSRRDRYRRPGRGHSHGGRASKRAMCCWWPGKGHETGQIVGGTVMPFSDHDMRPRQVRSSERRG